MTQKKKPKVYITRRLPEVVETRMRELFDAELNIDDTPRTQPELVAAVKSADVLVPTLTDRIDAALIEQAGPQLKLIACFSNGVDNVDVEAAARRGITVTNTPNVLTEDRGSSRLGQGCSAQSCWVEIVPWREALPAITAFDPPAFISADALS